MRVNPLLRFRSLGAGQHYVFRGNDGELFHVEAEPAFAALAAAHRDLLRAPDTIPDMAALAARIGLPAALITDLLLTDDLPPWLHNEFDAPDFLPSIQGRMRLFFVFPSYDCNLACAYCTYSGIYPQERTHLPLKMDAARMGDAVQLIRESARHSPDADIVFYGDEPLTNPPAVLGFMDALTAAGNDGTRFHFQIVTNGLLLSETIARACIARGVKLQLSLDGPPAVHDRYRRTRGGRPTHARVMAKLKMLADLDADYLATKVGIGCTLAPPFETPSDLAAIDRWFAEQPLFAGFSGYRGNFSVSVMNPTDATAGSAHPAYQAGDLDTYRVQMRELYERFAAALIRGDQDDTRFLPAALFLATFYRFSSRCTETPAHWRRWRHTGDCLPGAGGLAIGADGKLFVCNSLNLHPIGDTSRGLDPAILRTQRDRYLEVRNGPCRSCWINRFCPLCPAAFKYAENSFLERLDCRSVARQYDDLLDFYIRATTEAPEQLRRLLSR